jgi:hypothetical protein
MKQIRTGAGARNGVFRAVMFLAATAAAGMRGLWSRPQYGRGNRGGKSLSYDVHTPRCHTQKKIYKGFTARRA